MQEFHSCDFLHPQTQNHFLPPMVGADSLRTSNIKDHACTNQHNHAMLLLNPSSAVWVEAIINLFATETGRDHDRINVLCLKPKSFPYVAFLLIALLVFKNRTLVGN